MAAILNLRNQMAHDALTVFCNPQEFAAPMLLDGYPVTAVMADAGTDMRHGLEPDIPRMTRVLSVPVAQLPTGYAPGVVITVDDTRWTVVDALVDYGMWQITITLER